MPDLKHFGLCEPWPLADVAAISVDAVGAAPAAVADGAAAAVAVDAVGAAPAAAAVDAVGAAPAAVAVDADDAGPAAGGECAVKDEQPPHPSHPEMCSGLLYTLRSVVAIRLFY